MVCFVASVAPLFMFATVVILRGGFPTPVAALAKIAGISLLVLNASAFGSKKRWWLCGPMLSLLVLAFVTATGLLAVGGTAWTAWVFAAAGVLLYGWNTARCVAQAGFLRTTALLALGLFLGLYAESMYWRINSVHDVVYPESIIAGRVATDVAEQAAVVNMIATYKLASTGLDGLVPLKYHNGSLWIAEGLRRLCGFRAIDFLAYGYGILLIPLYIVSFFGCAELLRAAVRREFGIPPFVFWAVTTVAFVGIFPFMDDPVHLNFNEAIINSDSFLLAITMSLLLIRAAVWFREWLHGRDYVWPLGEKIALAAIIPLVLGLTGWVKISQVYLLLSLLVWLVLRVKWMRAWPFLLGTAISSGILAIMLVGERGANLSSFAPFNFDRVSPEWVPYFFFVYFTWVWLLLLVWVRTHQVRTIAEFWQLLKARDAILVELAFVTAVSGMVPYLLINFYSANWKYFTEFQALMAGVFLVAILPQFRWADLFQQIRSGSLPLTRVLLLGLSAAVCGHLFMTTMASAYRMVKRGCETRAVLAGMPDTEWHQSLRQIRARRSVVADSFSKREELVGCLVHVGGESVEQRRGIALYVPKTNRTYWDMRQVGSGTTPFIAPAFASLPMVDGLPEYDDIGWSRVGWGYPQYKLPTEAETPAEELDHAIQRARHEGFRGLLVLREASKGECGIQEIPLI